MYKLYLLYRFIKESFTTVLNSTCGECEIPVWEKYTLSIEEAAEYFRIGENKLRNIINKDEFAEFILWNGNRAQIKRKDIRRYENIYKVSEKIPTMKSIQN